MNEPTVALRFDDPSLHPADEPEFSSGMPMQTVGQIASGRLLTCPPSTAVAEAAHLMRHHRCSSILVVEGGRPVGIWTERDALAIDFARPDSFDAPIASVMNPEVKCIPADATVGAAGLQFRQDAVRHLLVVDADGAPLGMLSQTDVVLNHGVEHYLTFRDVRSVMSRNVTILAADTLLGDAAQAIRTESGEAAMVTSPDWPEAGIVTERDIVRMIAERRGGTVGEAATRPLVAIHPNATLLSARNLFAQHGFRHLAVRDDDGAYIGLLGFSDILAVLEHEYLAQLNSALRERDEALLRSRKDLHLARQVIEATLDGVMIVDDQARIEYINPAFTLLTGYTADEILGRNPRLLQSGRQDADFYAEMWRALIETGHWQGEIWNRRKDGSIFAEWLTINSIRAEDGSIAKFAAIFSDITEKKLKEEQVHNLAYYDPLTQLPNRRCFTDQLGQAIALAQRRDNRLALMFLDLDLFKGINDTFGHDIGDAVLAEVARRLVDCLREGDIVARIGGDEFVVLMPELREENDTARLAARLIAAVRAPIPIAERELQVTTSVGIALFPDDGEDADSLLKAADTAMYQAKQIGRNDYQRYARPAHGGSAATLTLAQCLPDAVEKGEMSLAYRASADLDSGMMCGAEAVLRWTHPELGEVPPAEFMPVAEHLGLIPALGDWALRTACRQHREWLDRGLPMLRLTVPLAAQQVLQGAFAETVASALQETGLPAHALAVEVDEATLLDHPGEVGRLLASLQAVGVKIVLADFGSARSSLTLLGQLPIDIVKIDLRKITGPQTPSTGKNLLGAMIDLGHSLGMRVLVDQLETPEQLAALRAAGPEEVQGPLLGGPAPAEALASQCRQALLPTP